MPIPLLAVEDLTVEFRTRDGVVTALKSVGLDAISAEAIYKLTTIPTIEDRFVFPPYHREMDIEALNDPLSAKGDVGFGYHETPARGL